MYIYIYITDIMYIHTYHTIPCIALHRIALHYIALHTYNEFNALFNFMAGFRPPFSSCSIICRRLPEVMQ